MSDRVTPSPETRGLRLTGALCVLFVASFFFMVSQELPYGDADDTGAALLAFLGEHQTEAKIEVVAQGFVVVVWAVLAPLLYGVLRVAEPLRRPTWSAVAFAGAFGVVAFVGMAVAIQRALVLGTGDADAEAGAYVLAQHVSDGLFAVATLMVGVFLLGAGIVIVLERPVRRWLGWLASVGAAASISGGLLGLIDNAEEGVAGALGFVGQLAWLLFVLLLGVYLFRRRFTASPIVPAV